MTICIAAICDQQKAIVVASDKMLTADFYDLQFEQPDPKFEALGESCVGLTAGDADAHIELFRAIRKNIADWKSPEVEMIAEMVKDQFVYLRKKRAEAYVLQPRGITLNQFYSGAFIRDNPNEWVLGVDREIRNFRYRVEILIAGVDISGAHIYSVEDPGVTYCFDGLGYATIGSGERHAFNSIVDNHYNINLGIKQTVYLIYEAKKRAEHAPGVGQAVEIAIVTRNGITQLDESQKSQLEKIYIQKTAPKLKDIDDAIDQLNIEN
jgi:20S proteasome alpha/beta subunit